MAFAWGAFRGSRPRAPFQMLKRPRRKLCTQAEPNPHNVAPSISPMGQLGQALGIGALVFTPLYAIGVEYYLDYANQPKRDGTVPPELDKDTVPFVVEKELALCLPDVEKQLSSQVKSGKASERDMLMLTRLLAYYKNQGQFSKAIALAEELIRDTPTQSTKVELTGHLALLHLHSAAAQEPTERVKAWKQASQLASTLKTSKDISAGGKALADNILLSVAIQTKDWKAAEALMGSVSENTKSLRTRQIAYLKNEKSIEEEIKKDPKDTISLMKSAWIGIWTHDLERARRCAEQVLRAGTIADDLLEVLALNMKFIPADDVYYGVYAKATGKRLAEALFECPQIEAINVLCQAYSTMHLDPLSVEQSMESLFPTLSPNTRALVLCHGLTNVSEEYSQLDQRLGEHFLKVAYKDPKYTSAYYYRLSMLYSGLGRKDWAAACLRRALDASPSSPILKQQEAILFEHYTKLLQLVTRNDDRPPVFDMAVPNQSLLDRIMPSRK